MKLNKVAFGFAAGIIWGGIVFLATWWIVVRGGTGEMISRLGRFYIGYAPSPSGSILGLIYGFVSAFIVGVLFAAIYNAFAVPAEGVADEVAPPAPEDEEGAHEEEPATPSYEEIGFWVR